MDKQHSEKLIVNEGWTLFAHDGIVTIENGYGGLLRNMQARMMT
jgi:hypothetical protein